MNDKPLKTLPRKPDGSFADKFEANGKTYFIRTPKMGIGITRHTMLLKSEVPFGYAMGFGDIRQAWADQIKLLNEFVRGKNNLQDVFAHAKDKFDCIKETSDAEYHRSAWVCCLFIVREDEDLKIWDEHYQKTKIEDWLEEGYNETDFFNLAVLMLRDFSKVSKEF